MDVVAVEVFKMVDAMFLSWALGIVATVGSLLMLYY